MIRADEVREAGRHVDQVATEIFGWDCGLELLDTRELDLVKWVVTDKDRNEIGQIVIMKGCGPWTMEQRGLVKRRPLQTENGRTDEKA